MNSHSFSVFVSMNAFVNSPVKELAALPPCCEGVCRHGVLSALSPLTMIQTMFNHTEVPGLTRRAYPQHAHAKGCRREIWLLFARHVREVYYWWYLSAENRNTKPSVGAVDCYIRRRPAQGEQQCCNTTFFPMIISGAYTLKHDLFSHDTAHSQHTESLLRREDSSHLNSKRENQSLQTAPQILFIIYDRYSKYEVVHIHRYTAHTHLWAERFSIYLP